MKGVQRSIIGCRALLQALALVSVSITLLTLSLPSHRSVLFTIINFGNVFPAVDFSESYS